MKIRLIVNNYQGCCWEKQKQVVNNFDIEKKRLHIIMCLSDILCVTDRCIAKSLKAFEMSYLVSVILSRLHCKDGKMSK